MLEADEMQGGLRIIKGDGAPADTGRRVEGITEAPMERPAAKSLHGLLFAALLAALLPGPARAGSLETAAPAEGAACQVPGAADAPASPPPAALGDHWARLAAEAPQARAEGYRPLNTRGYNYAADSRGLEQAALDFEAGGARPAAP